jgi:hypothetical protein
MTPSVLKSPAISQWTIDQYIQTPIHRKRTNRYIVSTELIHYAFGDGLTIS